MFTATIKVNGKVVLDDESIHWNFFTLSEQVEETLWYDKMFSFEVSNLVCKSYITNEVLDVIATQIICEEEGLSSIVLSHFKPSCGPFDESLLDRLTKSCIKLQILEVTDMRDLSTVSRH